MRFYGKLVHAFHTPVGTSRQTGADALISIPMKQLLATSDPTVIAEGRVVAIGDGLELYLEDREEPVTRGRLILGNPEGLGLMERLTASGGE